MPAPRAAIEHLRAIVHPYGPCWNSDALLRRNTRERYQFGR
jgi:hypothetical protein